MMMIFLVIDLFRFWGLKSKKYSFLENFNIFCLSVLRYFSISFLFYSTMFLVVFLYQLSEMLGSELDQVISLGLTLGQWLGFYATIFLFFVYLFCIFVIVNRDNWLYSYVDKLNLERGDDR